MRVIKLEFVTRIRRRDFVYTIQEELTDGQTSYRIEFKVIGESPPLYAEIIGAEGQRKKLFKLLASLERTTHETPPPPTERSLRGVPPSREAEMLWSVLDLPVAEVTQQTSYRKRIARVLTPQQIFFVGELVQKTEAEIRLIPGLQCETTISLRLIEGFLAKHNLYFGMISAELFGWAPPTTQK